MSRNGKRGDLIAPQIAVVDGVAVTIYHGIPFCCRSGWHRKDAVIRDGHCIGTITRLFDGEREVVMTLAVDGTGAPGLRIDYLIKHCRSPVAQDLFMQELKAS
jgi:hypothetical protein